MSADYEQEQTSEFFVGYLPVPANRKRFLKFLFVGSICGMIFLAMSLAASQKDPGTGVWEEGRLTVLSGTVSVDPYPLIRVASEASGRPIRTFLIVSQGKFGARDRLKRFADQVVQVRGTILHRDDRWMLELDDGPTSIQPVSMDGAVRQSLIVNDIQTLGPVNLRGEIIDPKCYIGAMKPGGGKTHRACAQLCVSGGIPPMLVTRDSQMRETFYLLVTSNGGEANETVLSFIGDPVSVSGQLERRGEINVVRLDPQGIQRL